MIIRPKTKRRVLILVAGLAIFSLAAAWLYSYRMEIAEQRLQHDKDLGLQAYKDGQYQTALSKLAEYINHEEKRDSSKIDPEALLAFAVSRAHTPTANEDYLIQAIKTLQWYCTLVP